MLRIINGSSEHEDFEDYEGKIVEINANSYKTMALIEAVNFPSPDPVCPEDDNHVQLVLAAKNWVGCPPMINFVYNNPQDPDDVEGHWVC